MAMGLSITKLYGGYAGQDVLKDVSITVPDGQIVALIGLNGAGKSTTFKHIIGERPIRAGKVVLNEVDLVQNPTAFKEQLAYIPEQPILYDELTLAEHIHLMLASHGLDDQAHWHQAMTLLATFRLDDKLHWLPKHFSKGMQQKVMLVAAFSLEAPLMVIDEPFLGLDVLAQKALVQLMEDRTKAGGAILLTTHLLSSAAAFVDQFVWLDQGEVREQASPEELAAEHQISLAEMDELFS
ncbi:ABC-type multidrug transport system [Fructobacillus tropaeoli]|uniref:Multidrug ABC transporter ATPase n=2 Tax=Fructobacillus tropaeoli TaxID=709323 RepID=A0A3F3GZP2_9LACO|nr:multidrug ABC transporter ATPase [Fructobacillus tropaeoli]CAK1239577.1 ABC-type multidrug transport system [Fructobacillus tropaeoli]